MTVIGNVRMPVTFVESFVTQKGNGRFARYQWPSMPVTIKGFSRSATLVCLNTVCMNRE